VDGVAVEEAVKTTLTFSAFAAVISNVAVASLFTS